MNIGQVALRDASRGKVMSILADKTAGKSYRAHKFALETEGRPLMDQRDANIIWKRRAETDHRTTYVDLSGLSKRLSAKDDQILSYFLDGSRRVFKVDDMAYTKSGGRSSIYPVIAGQLGVGCCHRLGKKVKPVQFKREFVLSVPDIADPDGRPSFWEEVANELNTVSQLRRLGIEFSRVLPYKTAQLDDKQLDDRAAACVQSRMIECEKDLVAELVRDGRLDQNNYLVKDGTLEYRPTREDRADKKRYQVFKNNYNWVIGVSKSFNPDICEDLTGRANPGFIADLPLHHRTPVAEYENPVLGDIKFAVWYVRLRANTSTRSAFDGIVKVGKILVTDEETEVGIESDLVDTLSAYLINERNPTCYGADMRWANHIYPIYLTESYVKSLYLGTESFLHLF